MQEHFQKFVRDQELYSADEAVLLAVSGGMDSMVMAHLFKESGAAFGIAHCNFRLRGQASDLDEEMVRKMASDWEIPFYCTRWDTAALAQKRKQSIQLCARELRYQWLEEVRRHHRYHRIATAHHLNDSLETILFNFAKGCGIRGLSGIPVKNGRIIRPLLFASREQILRYQKKQQLHYREDTSNKSEKYARNRIRNKVVPVLKSINPGLEQTIAENISRFQEAFQLYEYAVEQLCDGLIREEESLTTIAFEKIKELPAAGSLLFELLSPFGFNNSQVSQLLQLPAGAAGREFLSPGFQLLAERGKLLIRALPKKQTPVSFTIPGPLESLQLPEDQSLRFEKLDHPPPSFAEDAATAVLDEERLNFPLTLRHWQAGDHFQPLGMGGKTQSLQDFFTNNKLSRIEKEGCWLLLSGNEICWVVGHRIDERFKIREDSASCIRIHWTRG